MYLHPFNLVTSKSSDENTLKQESEANLCGKHTFMRFIKDYICSLVKTFKNSLKKAYVKIDLFTKILALT